MEGKRVLPKKNPNKLGNIPLSTDLFLPPPPQQREHGHTMSGMGSGGVRSEQEVQQVLPVTDFKWDKININTSTKIGQTGFLLHI